MENAGLFGRLSAEIRNKILHFIVVNDEAIHLDPAPQMPSDEKIQALKDEYKRSHPGQRPYHLYKPAIRKSLDAERKKIKMQVVQPALTRTCRIIRQETLPVFYGANIFVLREELSRSYSGPEGKAGFHHGLNWLKKLGPTSRRLLRQTYVPGREEFLGSLFSWVGMLKHMAGRDRIAFEVVKGFTLNGAEEKLYGLTEDGRRYEYSKVTFL